MIRFSLACRPLKTSILVPLLCSLTTAVYSPVGLQMSRIGLYLEGAWKTVSLITFLFDSGCLLGKVLTVSDVSSLYGCLSIKVV